MRGRNALQTRRPRALGQGVDRVSVDDRWDALLRGLIEECGYRLHGGLVPAQSRTYHQRLRGACFECDGYVLER